MLIGSVISIAHGVGLPVFTNVFGDFINVFIDQEITQKLGFLGNDTDVNCKDPNTFNPLYVGLSIANLTNNTFPCPYVITNISNYSSVIESCFSSGNKCLDNVDFIEKVNLLLFYFIGITGGVFILSFFQLSLFQTACERQVKKIRLAYYKSIMRQEIEWFDYNSCGEIACRMAE